MSYIIESSLNLKFSNVFHAWASAFHAVNNHSSATLEACMRQFQITFAPPGCRLSSKHKPCLKSRGGCLKSRP